MSKKTKIKDIAENIICYLVIYGIPILLCLIAIAYFVLYIYCFFTYGDKPITEIPSWVWWVMYSGGNK